MDGEVISAIITAIATVFIAWFTGTLWQSNKAQLRHQRQIERPYVSGGGAPASNDRTVFVLTVQNYGRTPGVISHYAVELCLRGNLPPAPDYLNANYPWVSWVATISPGGQTIPLTTRPIPSALTSSLTEGFDILPLGGLKNLSSASSYLWGSATIIRLWLM
jgi:hypothetical protein